MHPGFSRFFLAVGLALAAVLRLGAQSAPAPAGPPPAFPPEAYTGLGYIFAENSKLDRLGWTDAQFEAFVAGMRDAFHGKVHAADPRVQALHAEVGRRVQQLASSQAQAARDFFKDPAKLAQFMKDAAKAFKMEISDSGLAYVVRAREGSIRPEPGDTVVISCRVRASDSKTELPQLSLDHKSSKVSDLSPGLAEAVQMMTTGSTVMLIVPPALSYGDGAWPEGVEEGTPLFYLMTLEQVTPGS